MPSAVIYPAIGVLSKDNYVLGNNLANGLATSSYRQSISWVGRTKPPNRRWPGYGRISEPYPVHGRLLQTHHHRFTAFRAGTHADGFLNGGSKHWAGRKQRDGIFACRPATSTEQERAALAGQPILTCPSTEIRCWLSDPRATPSAAVRVWAKPISPVIGQPLGSFYGYKQLGIFQNQADLDANPQNDATSHPGDVKYADIDGDGKITANDRTILGNNQPDFIYGLTNSFTATKALI